MGEQMPPLDVEAFWAWLVVQPDGAEVGVSCDSARCPLARFLVERYGGYWLVGPDDVCWIEGVDVRGEWELPVWAKVFILRADASVVGMEKPISREVVLVVLDGIVREMREGQ